MLRLRNPVLSDRTRLCILGCMLKFLIRVLSCCVAVTVRRLVMLVLTTSIPVGWTALVVAASTGKNPGEVRVVTSMVPQLVTLVREDSMLTVRVWAACGSSLTVKVARG